MKMQKNLIIGIIATAIVAGGGGFFGGMAYGQSLTPARNMNGQFAGRNINGTGSAAGNRLRAGTGFVNGDILSKDDKSVTVKNRAGGSQIIFYAPSTLIGKSTAGTSADLTVGENVTVNGTANSDGTVTATNIQIRPAGEIPFGGPNGNVPNNK